MSITVSSFVKDTKKPNNTENNTLFSKKCSSLWVDKHKPTKISEIVGNKNNILKIKQWLIDHKNRVLGTPKAILVSGAPGIGKTSSCRLIGNLLGYNVIEYNASDVRSKKNIENIVYESSVNHNITTMAKTYRPTLIIMDEVGGMSTGDRGGISSLIKIINPLKGRRNVKKVEKERMKNRWIAPIICICNTQNIKKLKNLLTIVEEIKFVRPSNNDLRCVLERVCSKEKISIEDEAINILINFSQCDVRRLLYILQELCLSYQETPIITLKDAKNLLFSFKKKDLDIGLFEATEALLNTSSYNIDSLYKLFYTDQTLIPLMIQENYIEYSISKTKANKIQQVEEIDIISDMLSYGDIINNSMYKISNWSMIESMGFFSTVCPSSRIKQFSKKYGMYNRRKTLKFASALGKLSTHSSKKKAFRRIKNLSKFALNDRYTVFAYKKLLFNYLLSKDEVEKGIELLKLYKFDITIISDLLKICSIYDKTTYKKKFTTKFKNRLKRLYDSSNQNYEKI